MSKELIALVDGSDTDVTIPALVCVLSLVLASTGQDRTQSLMFVNKSVISAYEDFIPTTKEK
jgi:hypothetical protein